MRHWRTYLVVCAAVLLGGCSSPRLNSPPVTATATQTVQQPHLAPLTMQQAWGQVHFSQFSLDLGGRYFAPNAQHNGISADGMACGSTYPMQRGPAGATPDVQSVGVMDLHTGHITLFATMPAGYFQPNCTVTGPWVIWTEAIGYSSGPTAEHWTLKAYNLQTGQTVQLDQSRPVDVQHPHASFSPTPSASNGRVVWTTYAADTFGATQSEMYTFATSTKTLLAPHTSIAQISWPWATWVDDTTHALVFKNLETQQQVQRHLPELPLDYTPLGTFSGTSFVTPNLDLSQILFVPSILAPSTRSLVVEDKFNDGSDFVQFPTLNDRLISWGRLNSWLVFDRKLQRPVKIPIGIQGFGGEVSGHYLIAQPSMTQAEFDAQRHGQPFHPVLLVLDTNTLP